MDQNFLSQLDQEIAEIREAGLYKAERIIVSRQGTVIRMQNGSEAINLCANNYLGLSGDPDVIEAARDALTEHGFGMSSVRFICGTQDVHSQLESRLSEFLGTEDTILYSSCFDANTGLFETILGPDDAVISDSLNHASIIDGIRLCKAARYRYANNDMADLESKLQGAQGARRRLIATDGVFSMDGSYADLKLICDLADRYNALVMVDDSHAVGFIGERGRGTPELAGQMERVDIVTGTLGKALGGASGGYTSGRKEIIELLRQRSRPYLFSNTLAPVIAATSLSVLDTLEASSDLRSKLKENSQRFRAGMTSAGFDLVPGDHPIIPVMLGDAGVAAEMAERLLSEGIYVVGFSYPVVPMGKARIRTQLSAAHTFDQIDLAIDAFTRVGRDMKVIG
ncbi:MAG TPA: glycine C-acetyltransferase [Dehalococcoidia bacterium]|nr:glycine C-acetyltransferase [Dehalococcoidia bacterium]HIK90288.1 glycine C-acetyltransferase [Dehalococcoidia bacterium]